VAVAGWVLDKSAAVVVREIPLEGECAAEQVRRCRCLQEGLAEADRQFVTVARGSSRVPLLELPDLADVQPSGEFGQLRGDRRLQRAGGMWHRTPIPDLLIAETALHHDLGVLHVDGDYSRISEVRPLTARRLG